MSFDKDTEPVQQDIIGLVMGDDKPKTHQRWPNPMPLKPDAARTCKHPRYRLFFWTPKGHPRPLGMCCACGAVLRAEVKTRQVITRALTRVK